MRLSVLGFSVCAACSPRPSAVSVESLPPALRVQSSPSSVPYARPHPSAATACPKVAEPRVTGTLSESSLAEASGLVASRENAGTLWTHNDSGDGPHLYAIEESGVSQARVTLEGAQARDWEDLALAPCPGSDSSCLYVGDIGDNLLTRERVQVYWAGEPFLHKGRGLEFSVPASRVDIRYEDGPKDAETLLVDPLSGDLLIVEKGPLLSLEAPVGVYRVPAAELQKGQVVARRVGTLPVGAATGGDVLPDGSGVMVRSYVRLWYWPRDPRVSLHAALSALSCELPLADLGEQGEAIAFLPDARGYLTLAEGEHAAIYRYPFVAR